MCSSNGVHVKFHGSGHERNSFVACCRCCSVQSRVVFTPSSRVCPRCRHGRDPRKIRRTSGTIPFRTRTWVHPRKPTRAAMIGPARPLAEPLNSASFRESRPVPNRGLSPAPRGAATTGNHRCSSQKPGSFRQRLDVRIEDRPGIPCSRPLENLRCSGRSGRLLWTQFFPFDNFTGRICSKALRGC